MHRHLGVWWRGVAIAALLLAPVRAAPGADAAPPIAMIVRDPRLPGLAYGVDAVDQVVQSADGGKTWAAIFSPGDPLAPDPATPGACLPGTYAHVTFLSPDPTHPRGLYVGTDGALGDPGDNGCGNASGGLFYRTTDTGAFLPLNHGLPASQDGHGGLAWGLRTIAFTPLHPGTLYVATDPSFLAPAANAHSAVPAEPGLYRSSDGGLQWQPAFAGLAGTPCGATTCRYPGSLAIDPSTPSLLLYGTATGLYRSIDGGEHWTQRAALDIGQPTHIVTRIDPYRPSIAYIVTDRAIYRTGDAGIHVARLVRPDLPAAAMVVDLRFQPGTSAAVVFLLRGGGTLRLLDAPLAATQVGPVAAASATPASIPSAIPPGTPRPTSAASPSASPSPAPSAPPGGATAGGWPMPGHDPGQSFAAPGDTPHAATLAAVGLRWQRPGAVPAIEVAGKLYAIDASTGQVTAYGARDGVAIHRYNSTGVRGLAAAGGLLYFNRGSEIRIVDAATAAWHFTAVAPGQQGTGGATIGTVIAAGRSLFAGVASQAGAAAGRQYAFDARSGRLLWTRPSGASTTPCLAVGTLFLSAGPLGAGDSSLIDPATGAVRRTLKGYGTAQWHTSGERIYAGVLRGRSGRYAALIDAYDTQGRYRWTAHDVFFGAASAALVAAVAPGVVEGRSAADGHTLWQVPIAGVQPGSSGSGVLIAGRLVLAQSANGNITLLDAASGRLLRVLQPPIPGTNAADLLVGDGMIYESVTHTAGGAHTTELLAFGVA